MTSFSVRAPVALRKARLLRIHQLAPAFVDNACVDLLLDLGLARENVWLTDLAGVVYEGRRELMDPRRARFAQATGARTLKEVIGGADIFLGLSAGGVLTQEMVK